MKDNDKFKPKKNQVILIYGAFPPSKDLKPYNPKKDETIKMYGVFEPDFDLDEILDNDNYTNKNDKI